MTKNNQSITAKPHAHLQTLTKTPAKFQKDQAKTVEVVEFTRIDTLCDSKTDGRKGNNNMSPDPDVGRHKYAAPNVAHRRHYIKSHGKENL